MKRLTALSITFLLAFGTGKIFAQIYSENVQPSSELREAFLNPPDEARPRVWWHWMKRAGIGDIHHFDAGLYTPTNYRTKVE